MTAKNKTCDSTDKFSTAFEAVAWIFNAMMQFTEGMVHRVAGFPVRQQR